MAIISLIGIVVAVAVFVYLAFKNVNLFVDAVIAAMIIIITAWLPLMDTLKTTYMTGLSGFLKNYLFLFAMSAIFGRFMEETGNCRRIAFAISKLTYKTKNRKFWAILTLPLFYFILTYVGISGFVLVFTILPIGRELFEELDIPWLFYCYGSAGMFPAMVLGGSLQPVNLIATGAYNVAPTAGFLLSLILVAIMWIVIFLIIKRDLANANMRGESFLPGGAPIKALQFATPLTEEKLPSIIGALVPLLVPILGLSVFKLDVLISLGLGILVCFIFDILSKKNIKSIINTSSKGALDAISPVVNVAAASGLVGIITITPGFKIVLDAFNNLPPAIAASTLVAIMSGFVASSSSSIPSLMPYVIEKYTEAGIGVTTGARLAALSTFTYLAPHNPGIVNAVSLTKLNYAKAAGIYIKGSYISGFIALAVGLILAGLKVF